MPKMWPNLLITKVYLISLWLFFSNACKEDMLFVLKEMKYRSTMLKKYDVIHDINGKWSGILTKCIQKKGPCECAKCILFHLVSGPHKVVKVCF